MADSSVQAAEPESATTTNGCVSKREVAAKQKAKIRERVVLAWVAVALHLLWLNFSIVQAVLEVSERSAECITDCTRTEKAPPRSNIGSMSVDDPTPASLANLSGPPYFVASIVNGELVANEQDASLTIAQARPSIPCPSSSQHGSPPQ